MAKTFGEPGAGALRPHNFYKLRLYLKINPKITWSDHFSLHGQPYGPPFPQVSFAGEPKEVFAMVPAYPFISVISIFILQNRDKLAFWGGGRGHFPFFR